MKIFTLCYVREKGKTLMIHRNKKDNDVHEGKWNGLGGKLEQGESPEECAVREVYEESGLLGKNPKLKGIITAPMFYKKVSYPTGLSLCLCASVFQSSFWSYDCFKQE